MRVALLAFAALLLVSSHALAELDNLNETAYKDGGNSGSLTANCSSAIAWGCVDQSVSDAAPIGLGPASLIPAFVLLAAFGLALRRR
jgi:hypothetical protein